jgi:hypothetical protein
MRREKLSIKRSIKIGLLSGLFFAATLAIFDYFNGSSFSIWKAVINTLVFGFVMTIFFQYQYKKE